MPFATIMARRLGRNSRKSSHSAPIIRFTIKAAPHHIALLLLLALLTNACVSSRQVATSFVVEETDIHVLLLPPPELIKTYLPGHPDELPADSAFGPEDDRAEFISQTDDSLYVEQFMTSIRHYLDVLYVNHYGPDEVDEFFELDVPAYIFAVGQMELLEYVDQETFAGYADGQRYQASVDVTVLEANVWFEFMKLHDPDEEMQLLFDVRSTSDYVDGRFVRSRDGSVRFDPQRFPLTLDDVYDLAAFSGKRNAQNIFDHLMNLYVEQSLGRETDLYFHYDVDEHQLRERDYPPFIPIPLEEQPGDPEAE